jgi:hypothetical protein
VKPGSARDKFPGVGNLPTRSWADLARLDSADGSGMTVEGYKLDFVGFAIGINMNNGTDIARLEAVRRQGLGEDHSVVFFDHGRNISQWVGTDQPRVLGAFVDDPNASDGRVLACRTRKRAFDHIFRAVGSQNNVLHIVD